MTPLFGVILICLFTGMIVGVLAGLLGIGGGVLIVPILTYVLVHMLGASVEYAIHVAIATSLSTIIFTGASSARSHIKLGNINFSVLSSCGVGVAVGAVIGAKVALFIDGPNLTLVFSILVIGIALNMLFGKVQERESMPRVATLVGAGVITGIISALMGVGGGAILVPLLCLFGVKMRTAIGSAAACGLVIALLGTLSFALSDIEGQPLAGYMLGYVFWPATLGISATSIVFATFGAKLGQEINTQKLKKIFAIFLVLVSIRMIWGMS